MKLTLLETDATGNTVADLSPSSADVSSNEPVTVPTPEAPPAARPRPSLDVAIETHRNLVQRIEALCLRLESWDLRHHMAEPSARFRAAVASLRESCDAVGFELDQLKASGYIAKSTPKTRMLARMRPGTPVRLKSAEVETEYRQLYSAEEIAALEVARVVGSRVLLRAGQRDVGLVEVRHLEPVL